MPVELPATSRTDLPGLLGFGSVGNGRVEANGSDISRRPGSAQSAAEAVAQVEDHDLRTEVNRLRAECDRLSDIQKRIMDALGTHSPDRLLHDVRNVLNERDLFKTLVATFDDEAARRLL